MTSRPPAGRPYSGAKAGATREQVERRERFERVRRDSLRPDADGPVVMYGWHTVTAALQNPARRLRSEERRVGKECRSRWSPYH